MLDYGPCGLSGLPVPEGTHLHGSLTGKIWLMLGGCSLGELPANFLAMALDALGLDFRGTFFLDPRGAGKLVTPPRTRHEKKQRMPWRFFREMPRFRTRQRNVEFYTCSKTIQMLSKISED
ncbi:unnamed protein product [Symbiodinium natans]|uniref:Uncharacterized protein n=1 Tax=Symbiodinium natans TaxID=878477 RepID=A0A812J5Y2_9DINO|nr:unnamed protein product [Symbiodinium natans]